MKALSSRRSKSNITKTILYSKVEPRKITDKIRDVSSNVFQYVKLVQIHSVQGRSLRTDLYPPSRASTDVTRGEQPQSLNLLTHAACVALSSQNITLSRKDALTQGYYFSRLRDPGCRKMHRIALLTCLLTVSLMNQGNRKLIFDFQNVSSDIYNEMDQ